jgi:hypothetical protein
MSRCFPDVNISHSCLNVTNDEKNLANFKIHNISFLNSNYDQLSDDQNEYIGISSVEQSWDTVIKKIKGTWLFDTVEWEPLLFPPRKDDPIHSEPVEKNMENISGCVPDVPMSGRISDVNIEKCNLNVDTKENTGDNYTYYSLGKYPEITLIFRQIEDFFDEVEGDIQKYKSGKCSEEYVKTKMNIIGLIIENLNKISIDELD